MQKLAIYMLLIIIMLCIILCAVRRDNIEAMLGNNINVSDFNRASNLMALNDTSISALKKCQVPTLTTEQCYRSRYYECPIANGSYLQCTNNYIPKPNEYNADCGNRTFDMVPYPWKISEDCYYNNIGFSRDIYQI